MTLILVLALLALVVLGATAYDVRTDGRGAACPPASHPVDRDAVPPAQRLGH